MTGTTRVIGRLRSTAPGKGAVRVEDVYDTDPQDLWSALDPGTEEETVIEAVLSPAGERTRLVVEERGIPLAGVAAYGAGWQAHVEDLAAYVPGRGTDWAARWAALTPVYEKLATDLA